MANLPPPPPGVTLDLPPPPDGVTLDQPSPKDRLLMAARATQKDPIASDIGNQLATVGRGGKWLNDKIQGIVGAGAAKTYQNFGEGANNAYALAAALPAGLIQAGLPKNKEEAGSMLLPMPAELPMPSDRVLGWGKKIASSPIGDAARGLAGIPRGVLQKASEVVSKRTPQAFEMLRQDPEGVLAAARKGMGLNSLTQTPEPLALSEAQAAGRTAQDIIDKSASGAGKDYQQMMDHLHGDLSSDKFDVAGKVYDTMEPYIKNQGASLRKPVGPNAEAGAKRIMDIYGEIKNSAREGMAPGEAADKLQELTAIQRNIPEMSAHAASLKDALLDSLPGDYKIPTVDTPTPGGWSISDTRTNYAKAKQLQRELKPFTSPQNPLAALKSVARAGGDASESLKAAIERIPELKAAIGKMNVSSAGAEFAPWATTPPGTGLTGAAGLLLTKLMTGNVAAVPGAALFGMGMSPRLTAESLVAGGKIGPKIMNLAREAQPRIPAVLAALIAKHRAQGSDTP